MNKLNKTLVVVNMEKFAYKMQQHWIMFVWIGKQLGRSLIIVWLQVKKNYFNFFFFYSY